ncbi:MAG: hypothetical protein Q8N26_25070 [Myxococcales bacterium]|nr:hypothetical protein [Myxococcales bacterium]
MDNKVIESVKRKVQNGTRGPALSALKKVPAQVKQLEKRAGQELKKAEGGLKRAARSAGALAKKYPGATAGALVGAGVLVGVAATRALHHEPTVGEVVMSALKRNAAKVSKRLATTASAGMSAGRARARRALR